MATTNDIAKIQTILGAEPDGIWGPKSQGALNGEIGQTAHTGNPKLRQIQTILGVKANGFWGTSSQNALNKERTKGGGTACTASSFADPKDVADFKACKAKGKTDKQCFAVGDNGIGQFGKVTSQTTTPMMAVNAAAMTARWGSINAAAHRAVSVTANGKTVVGTVEDRISAPGRIDLNPAAAKALGLTPPFLVPCVWKWV